MSAGLTVVVPAWNEAGRLRTTVEEVVAVARRTLTDFEVIIVNDGSSDGTAAVAEDLARRYACVSVIHHPRNLGVGAAYHSGLSRARFPFLTLIPGDHAFHQSSLDKLFSLVGQVPMIVTYRANPQARSPLRRMLSRWCTVAVCVVAGRAIRDAHSLYVFPVVEARQVPRNVGYGYHIEMLSTLLRGGLEFTEIPVWLNPRPDRSSKVMRLSVLTRLLATLTRQFIRFVVLRESVPLTSTNTQIVQSRCSPAPVEASA
jgi:glycosyltransferase involved in cell wall biosynthesis